MGKSSQIDPFLANLPKPYLVDHLAVNPGAFSPALNPSADEGILVLM
jgi:hypothetical protein